MRKNNQLIYLIIIIAVIIGCGGPSANNNQETTLLESNIQPEEFPADAVSNALPFTLQFVEKQYQGTPLPRLQSYAVAVSNEGPWIISGGRRQGLHTFQAKPVNNFIPDSSNHYIYLIDPESGSYSSFDVNLLPANLSAPLQATNQQFYYDSNTDQFYIIGGYGWNAEKTDMLTFNTIMRYDVSDMVAALKGTPTAQQIVSLIKSAQDDRFAVTGGELFLFNSNFYLVFGQKFTGQYRAFGGTDFSQKYTEEVRVFTLVPNSLKILSYGSTTNTESDRPFHRRDGNVFEDIDPSTGQPRITALGGVFQPGIIGAYTYPVYINNTSTPVIDRKGNQKFSQYGCPVISIYDDGDTATTYHTFFGGIGHYYYNQTDSQKIVYNIATEQGRNDGFPFLADITTFQQSANGTYNEYIHVNPIPGTRLLGSTVPFLLKRLIIQKGIAFNNGVIKLSGIPKGQKILIGYIYGGVEAKNPLPIIPNTGTFVSNSVFEVYLTNQPSPAIPASKAHESIKNDANLNTRN